MIANPYISSKLSELPELSGVYLMYDNMGEIIYVGKAINLKRRVTQYFRSGVHAVKVQAMVSKIADFSYVRTLSELDALVLESNLIKKHMPRYNILLKDDKGRGVYFKINTMLPYPNIVTTRQYKKDGAKYIGPMPHGVAVKQLLALVKLMYGVRTCSGKMSSKRECLDYHIGRCTAPCTNKISQEEYAERVKSMIAFLSGGDMGMRAELTEKMKRSAESGDFERAIIYRDLMQSLDRRAIKRLDNIKIDGDADVFAYVTDDVSSCVSLMPVRNNKLFECVNYLSLDASDDEEALTGFLMQYYMDNPVPKEIYVNAQPSSGLAETLSNLRGSVVKVHAPQKGQKRDLVRTAEENARDYLARNAEKLLASEQNTLGACDRLARHLGLSKVSRIECYDISHISGTDKVASGVCFVGGVKAAKEYRRYRIKTVEGNNDFECMAEVLGRRLARASSGDDKFTDMPDLIVVDGGKGQLSSAYEVMQNHGYDIPMIGLAKREEEVFISGRKEPIILSHSSPELKLLQRVRDEAHRFAITYHRNMRAKRIKSSLTDVEGVGEKKTKMLLKEFGSLKNISQLPLGVLESVKGIDRVTAKNIYEHFRAMREEN